MNKPMSERESERLARAQEIVKQGGVEIPAGVPIKQLQRECYEGSRLFTVVGSGGAYLTNSQICDCPAFRYHEGYSCKHQMAVLLALQEEGGRRRAAQVAPAPSEGGPKSGLLPRNFSDGQDWASPPRPEGWRPPPKKGSPQESPDELTESCQTRVESYFVAWMNEGGEI